MNQPSYNSPNRAPISVFGPALQMPQARAQRRWKEHLPWCLRVEISGERRAAFRTALCLSLHPAALQPWLDRLHEGSLLLRVIPLCPERPIPPGETVMQQQARLDRWLPPGWAGSAADGRLRWTRPTRFASFFRNFELQPMTVPLLTTDHWIGLDQVLLQSGTLASWLPNGEIWVFIQPTTHNG